MTGKDIFDRITESDIFDKISKPDIFDSIKLEVITPSKPSVIPPKVIVKPYVKTVPKPLTESEVIDLIKGEVSKIKPQKIVEKIIEKQIVKEKPKIVEKIVEKVIPDKRVEELTKKLEELTKQLENIKQVIPMMGHKGGSGVIGVPHPGGHSGQFLTNDGTELKWGNATAGLDGSVTFGDQDTDGSWRFIVVGTDLSHQRRESGVWVEKSADLAS